MAYDLEEQEKIATLKAWWKDNGNMVLMVIAAIAIAVAGWRGWAWHQHNQSLAAGGIYAQLSKGIAANDAKAVRDASGALIENHPRSLYASMGALASAKFLFDREDLKAAKLQLEWVAQKSPSAELRDIARLRLAGVLLDEKAHDEALKVLEAKHAASFEAQYALLRGDILVAKNQAEEAKAAYKLALEKSEKHGGDFRAGIQMRLDALGG